MHVCFVVFVSVFQYLLSQELGREERLRNDLFCETCPYCPVVNALSAVERNALNGRGLCRLGT